AQPHERRDPAGPAPPRDGSRATRAAGPARYLSPPGRDRSTAHECTPPTRPVAATPWWAPARPRRPAPNGQHARPDTAPGEPLAVERHHASVHRRRMRGGGDP